MGSRGQPVTLRAPMSPGGPARLELSGTSGEEAPGEEAAHSPSVSVRGLHLRAAGPSPRGRVGSEPEPRLAFCSSRRQKAPESPSGPWALGGLGSRSHRARKLCSGQLFLAGTEDECSGG